jgi:hypothetical protein
MEGCGVGGWDDQIPKVVKHVCVCVVSALDKQAGKERALGCRKNPQAFGTESAQGT